MNVWRGDPIFTWEGESLDPVSWEGNCTLFWKNLMGGARIIFTNFCCRQRQLIICLKKWYKSCYIPHPQDRFPKEGNTLNEDNDEFGEMIEWE